MMIFVCGIHGVGKTYYCQKKSEEFGIPYFTASNLIKKKNNQGFKEKKVYDISINQKILIEEVQKVQRQQNNFILDGHLCLLDMKGKIQKVQIEVLSKMNIESLVVIIDGVKEIQDKIWKRDGIKYETKFLEFFQNEEVKYAKKVASQLNIDLIITNGFNTIGNKFNNNIILPIKPIYAEKILNNTKKYEYRKKLCVDNIDKIYLYATAPVKGIVGEAVVTEKIIMNKKKMWRLTKEKSGIDFCIYEQYYRNCENACAYVLDKVKKYDKLVLLKDIDGISIPQSYTYIKNIIKCL